jgi:hypothetical protein
MEQSMKRGKHPKDTKHPRGGFITGNRRFRRGTRQTRPGDTTMGKARTSSS